MEEGEGVYQVWVEFADQEHTTLRSPLEAGTAARERYATCVQEMHKNPNAYGVSIAAVYLLDWERKQG